MTGPHCHRNANGWDGSLEIITTFAPGTPLGTAPSGLSIVKVFAAHLEHQYYGLDEVPATVSRAPGPER